jgi:predicted phosphohydrolase
VYKKKIVQGGCHEFWQTTTKKRMGAALKFLEHYHLDGDKFLDHIVTGYETWVSHFTPESKRQSLEWQHPPSPSKLRKFKHSENHGHGILGPERRPSG